MNPEKQRIAIALFALDISQLWRDILSSPESPEKSRQVEIFLFQTPDYLNDLNAIRKVEQKLIVIENPGKYLDQLILVVAKSQGFSGNCPKKALKYVGVSPVVCANAGQRAEATLRTIGKWEE